MLLVISLEGRAKDGEDRVKDGHEHLVQVPLQLRLRTTDSIGHLHVEREAFSLSCFGPIRNHCPAAQRRQAAQMSRQAAINTGRIAGLLRSFQEACRKKAHQQPPVP